MWKTTHNILRIAGALVIALLCHLTGVTTGAPSPVLAVTSPNADVTVTYRIQLPLEAPTGFTVTWITDKLVNISWVPGYGSNSTLVLAKVDSLPTGPTDGYILYSGNGSSANDTFTNLDIIGGRVYYAGFAVSENGSYSEAGTGDVEGLGVSELADSVDALTTVFGGMATTVEMLFGLLLVVGLFAATLAVKDWETKLVILVISGLASIYVGLEWVASSQILCIVITGLGTFQLIQAVILALSTGGQSKGSSQFKGIIGSIKGWF